MGRCIAIEVSQLHYLGMLSRRDYKLGELEVGEVEAR